MAYVVCLTLLLLVAVDTHRILGLFPMAAKSHMNVNDAIMRSLVTAGHEVVIVTPFPDQPPLKNYSIIDLSNKVQSFVNEFSLDSFADQSIYHIWEYFSDGEREACSILMNHPEIKKMFQSEEKLFDVIFFETILFYECLTPLAAKWKIPTIGTVTLSSDSTGDRAIDNPRFPAIIPNEFGHPWPLTNIYGRFRNTIKHIWTDMIRTYITWVRGNQFYRAHTEVLAPYSEYRQIQPSLIFFNGHFTLIPRAHNPNAIEIGGIHVQPAKPLSAKIKKFIEDAENGVVVFSLGSAVRASTLPNETLSAFKEAFRMIPQRVIWKYEDEMSDIPENVMVLRWIPQTDILAHKNVKAFISHCGMSGFYEAVHRAKPVLATPLFFDQFVNSEILEKNEAAVKIDIRSANKETILNALNSVINDTRYLLNMKDLSRRFNDRPMSPEETVAYWTDYIIRYEGAPHLQTPASKLYWFQYLLIDILACTLVILISGLYIVKWINKNIKMSFSRWCNDDDITRNKKLS